MVKELGNFKVMWIHAFPPKEGISKTISVQVLVVRNKVAAMEHCKTEF